MDREIAFKAALIREYLAVKGPALDARGAAFLQGLLMEPELLAKMHFTATPYKLRYRVLVGTARYYFPTFYVRCDGAGVREAPLNCYRWPVEKILAQLRQLPYWFLQVDKDFAAAHGIGDGAPLQDVLDSPAVERLLRDAARALRRRAHRRVILLRHIDQALAQKDKDRFMHLTAKYKKMCQ